MQSFNLDAVLYFPFVRFFAKSLAVPHFSVADISKINPDALKAYGFSGIVFDKDNTLTAPYVNEIYPSIKDAFDKYRLVFGDRMVIMSNSAGTLDDLDYVDARKIEEALGIQVLRHDRKKPGGIEAVTAFFKCAPQELVMIGDRIFTDVVFGNRYGLLTIHTALLTEEGDNAAAAKIRKYELPLIRAWVRKGIKAPSHKLYSPDICLESLI